MNIKIKTIPSQTCSDHDPNTALKYMDSLPTNKDLTLEFLIKKLFT